MSTKNIYFNIDRCVGCSACQIACKQENNLAPYNLEDALSGTSPIWRNVIEVEQGMYGNESVHYISLSCMHCADAPCVVACPTGALTKSTEDGRVLVDQSKCIGCRMCLQVCPFGIPQYGNDDLMQKCTLCVDRITKEGKESPACVAACPAKALTYGDTNTVSRDVQQKVAEKLILRTDNRYANEL
jgi:anaerobic dimethyl sulfoxide reductase subunit B (iron-sulfur subunit)